MHSKTIFLPTRIFSSKFLESSWFDLQSVLSWEPNEILPKTSRLIRSWRGEVLTVKKYLFNNKATVEDAYRVAHLASTKHKVVERTGQDLVNGANISCLICPHKEDLRGLSFT